MNNAKHLEELFVNIFRKPSLYTFNEKQQDMISECCRLFLNGVLQHYPEYSKTFIEKASGKLEWLNDTIFLNVSPTKAGSPQFIEKYNYHWTKTQHKTSVHLEIGTWIAWPDDRVEDYIRSENIGDFIRLDMDYSFRPDLAASATAIPLKDHSLDRVSSNSLFEHVAYPHKILEEAYRVLKPGGFSYTAVPFHFVQHDCPSDYLRYTGAFFEDVCRDMGFSEVYIDTKSTSGVYYTIHNLAKAAIVEATLPERERTIAQQFHTSVLVLLAILQAVDDDFLAYGASHWHTTHVIAVKKGHYQQKTGTIDRKRSFIERWKDHFISPDNGNKLFLSGNRLATADQSFEYSIIKGIPVLLPKNSPSFSILKSENKK